MKQFRIPPSCSNQVHQTQTKQSSSNNSFSIMQHVRIRSYTLDNLNLGSVSRSRCCSMKQMNSRVFGIQQDHIHDKRMLANPDHRIQQGGNTNEEKI